VFAEHGFNMRFLCRVLNFSVLKLQDKTAPKAIKFSTYKHFQHRRLQNLDY